MKQGNNLISGSFYTPISEYNCVNFSDTYFEISKLQFDKLIIK